MQEVLKQKDKVKKPKTFGAVNNAYEIYHLVHKAIAEDFMLSKDIVKSEQYAEYILRTKSQLNTLAYNLVVNIIMANIYPNNLLDYEEITALDITFWYKSWRNGILKSSKCRRSVFMIDKYFHMIYDNIIQINNRCYVLITK